MRKLPRDTRIVNLLKDIALPGSDGQQISLAFFDQAI
jgi:hypothetical protein